VPSGKNPVVLRRPRQAVLLLLRLRRHRQRRRLPDGIRSPQFSRSGRATGSTRRRRSTEGRRPARRTVTPATRPFANAVRFAVTRRPLLSPATEKRTGTQTGGGLPER